MQEEIGNQDSLQLQAVSSEETQPKLTEDLTKEENEQMENVLDITIKESNEEVATKRDETNLIQKDEELVEAEENINEQKIES